MKRSFGLPCLLVLVACAESAPLTPEELAPFRACDDVSECILAVNGPPTCGGRRGDVVSIHRDRADEFYETLGNDFPESCPATVAIAPIVPDQRFSENAYVLGCQLEGCTILEHHESSGKQCSDLTPCPASYRCEASDDHFGLSFCLYIGTSTGAN